MGTQTERRSTCASWSEATPPRRISARAVPPTRTRGPPDGEHEWYWVTPFWPETKTQRECLESVANAALTEVGLGGKYQFWVDQAGAVFVFRDGGPAVIDNEDEAMVDRALELGWDAAERTTSVHPATAVSDCSYGQTR
jgi:hypothetical protein